MLVLSIEPSSIAKTCYLHLYLRFKMISNIYTKKKICTKNKTERNKYNSSSKRLKSDTKKYKKKLLQRL